MRIRACYLDANLYAYLQAQRPDSAARLKSLVRAGRCRVFGSVELLEELAGAAIKGTNGANLLGLHWDIVGPNVLDYAHGLIRREIKKGTMLSYHEACVSPEFTHQLRTRSSDLTLMGDVLKEVTKNKKEYEDHARSVDQQVEGQLTQLIDRRGRKKALEGLSINKALINEWFVDGFASDPDFGLSSDEARRLNLAVLPCTSAMVAMFLSRMYGRHGLQPQVDFGSDLYDSSHYELAAFTGCLVTEDKRLQTASKRINWKPVRVLNAEQFTAALRTM